MVQHQAHAPLTRTVFHGLERDLPEHTFYGSVCLSEWIKVLDVSHQSSSGTRSFFPSKNIRKNEDLVLAFSPRVLPKGGLCAHKCIKESNVLLWFIHVSSLQHPPSYRPFLEDVTRLETLIWPILCRLSLARSSVIEPSWSFSYFSISTPIEMIICFWDQWSCLRAVYGAEGCCCCWSICGGLVPVACWPKRACLRARWSS